MKFNQIKSPVAFLLKVRNLLRIWLVFVVRLSVARLNCILFGHRKTHGFKLRAYSMVRHATRDINVCSRCAGIYSTALPEGVVDPIENMKREDLL